MKDGKRARPLRLVHSAPPAGTVFGAGTNTPPRLIDPAVDYWASYEGAAPRFLNPEDMARQVRAYQELKELADKAEVVAAGLGPQDIPWSEFFRCGEYYFDNPAEALSEYSSDSSSGLEFEAWLDWFHELLAEVGLEDEVPWDAAASEKILEFMMRPEEGFSEDSPVLALIPDFPARVATQEVNRKLALAREFFMNLRKPYLFWSVMVPTPQRREITQNCMVQPWVTVSFDERYPGMFSGQQELWCYFEPMTESVHSDEEDHFLYRLSAVWLDVDGAGNGRLIASASGYYIPLFGGKHTLGAGALAEICDYSEAWALDELNSFVQEKFLPLEGFLNVSEFVDWGGFDEGTAPGIALTWLHVPGSTQRIRYDQEPLERDFLFNITACLSEGNIHSFTTKGNHRPPFTEQDEDDSAQDGGDDFYDKMYEDAGPAHAPIRLFVVPVTGDSSEQLIQHPQAPEHLDEKPYKRLSIARYYRDIHNGFDLGFAIAPWTPNSD